LLFTLFLESSVPFVELPFLFNLFIASIHVLSRFSIAQETPSLLNKWASLDAVLLQKWLRPEVHVNQAVVFRHSGRHIVPFPAVSRCPTVAYG
jgi:hypothetical protein